MGALEAHTAMSSQALQSETVRNGLKDVLLGPARLYENLRREQNAENALAAGWRGRRPLNRPAATASPDLTFYDKDVTSGETEKLCFKPGEWVVVRIRIRDTARRRAITVTARNRK